MNLIKKKYTFYLVIYLILLVFGYILFEKINIYLFLIPLVFICFEFYFEELYFPKVTLKRRRKINNLLIEKYKNGKEIKDKKLRVLVNNRPIVFKFTTSTYRFRINNSLSFYLDISHIEENIKQLCKIHFHCTEIDNHLYVSGNVISSFFSNSLKTLTRKSEKAPVIRWGGVGGGVDLGDESYFPSLNGVWGSVLWSMTQYSTLSASFGAVFDVGTDDVLIDPLLEMFPAGVF